MSCTSCGSSSCGSGSGSSCGSCVDDCNPCGGPVSIVSKQGLTGANGTNGKGYMASSTTCIDVLTTGAGGFGPIQIDVNKAYTVGARVRFSDTANPSGNYFEGLVQSYDPVTGIMVVAPIDLRVGTGTICSWSVNLAGDPGDPASYYFQINQSIDFLDTFVMADANTGVNYSIGTITLNASVLGQNKSYFPGTPVKLSPTSVSGSAGNIRTPIPKIEGIVEAYVPQTGYLQLAVLGVSGTGTHTDWEVDLDWKFSTSRYLEGLVLPPSGAGSSHGGVTIPGNTFFSINQGVKVTMNGSRVTGSHPLEILYDGVVCFSKILTVPSDFQVEININLGYYVTISTRLITTAGTDDTIQFLGVNDPAYLFSTYKPNFKTDKLITFSNFGPTQPVAFYSSVAVRY